MHSHMHTSTGRHRDLMVTVKPKEPIMPKISLWVIKSLGSYMGDFTVYFLNSDSERVVLSWQCARLTQWWFARFRSYC